MRYTFYDYRQLFTFKDIDILYKDNAIIDAKQGGLLIGPPHDKYERTYMNAGIKFLFEVEHGFELHGEVEGFEYIVNRESADVYRNLLSEIQTPELYNYYEFTEYEFDKSIMTVDATTPDEKLYHSKFIILDTRGGFHIIDKCSTKKHLKTIDNINRMFID
jgi:hypothetical protein